MSAGDPDTRPSPCRGCGRPIMWGVTEEGKKIPLDPKPPVYRVVHDRSQDGKWTIRAIRKENCMVSHFATCPDANQFSGSRKKEAGYAAPVPGKYSHLSNDTTAPPSER